ncbi:methyltransferase [Dyella choica]|uniref:Class I SAM-dependent methyltransferase n=1 Tax=Dyella choica TaxID=1927959 RepID=A0A432M9C9_9GAMM|nr:class I SAM-dependent methyltransferase [Dyella choica]RUL78813.1 class I SAM-dependent methyltransferase [Dyella choica]
MEPTLPTSHTEDGAAVYSRRVLKIYDRWVLGFSNSHAWKCPTDTVLLQFFRQHLSTNHLDVGVGSGFYLANSASQPGQKVTLLDLNDNSLRAAAARIAPLQPTMVHEDVLQPSGALGDCKFSSISMFYLLHCLPGQMALKGSAVFHLLRKHLMANGTLYGATILGDQSGHNWIGRRLMKLYNRKGIFGNRQDTLTDLESALRRHFAKVTVWQQGHVALFRAEIPLS